MSTKNEDRRRFFRIIDAIGVSYRLKSGDGEKQISLEGKNISIHHLLEKHNDIINRALSEIEARDAVVGSVIAELNKKLDTMVALLELDSKPAYSIQQASISACGIAFPVSEELNENGLLDLDLYLETSGQEVNAVGRIVDCQPLPEEGAYYLRVEFTEMEDSHREKLIQYIVQRQGTLLRSLREEIDGL